MNLIKGFNYHLKRYTKHMEKFPNEYSHIRFIGTYAGDYNQRFQKRILKGYQHFHLYDRALENGAVLLGEKTDIEYGGNSWIPTQDWGEYTFTLSNIPIDYLVNDYVVLRARASGAGRDDWEYNDIIVKVVFS